MIRLIVFSDDWGRHPSSCQHLVGKLVERYPTLWVNTIGTRSPRLSMEDVGKAVEKLGQWITRSGNGRAGRVVIPENLSIITPMMWPGFRKGWQRRFNAGRLSRAVNAALGARRPGEKRIVVTTLAITADLIGRIDVDRWVYYCVDDFAVWPGLDSQVMLEMERQLVDRVDHAVAASEALQAGLSRLGRSSDLLTHGIDLDHWAIQSDVPSGPEPDGDDSSLDPWHGWWESLPRPIYLFWGLIDRRLDTAWCQALMSQDEPAGETRFEASADQRGSLVLVGPKQSPDPALADIDGLVMPGSMAYEDLPAVATAADVLVMPYADLPVTRAMQPLKFKEYLATGKPVVVRDLPATRPWADAADVVDQVASFVQLARKRASEGVPNEQLEMRQRLADESWECKAKYFEAMLLG